MLLISHCVLVAVCVNHYSDTYISHWILVLVAVCFNHYSDTYISYWILVLVAVCFNHYSDTYISHLKRDLFVAYFDSRVDVENMTFGLL